MSSLGKRKREPEWDATILLDETSHVHYQNNVLYLSFSELNIVDTSCMICDASATSTSTNIYPKRRFIQRTK